MEYLDETERLETAKQAVNAVLKTQSKMDDPRRNQRTRGRRADGRCKLYVQAETASRNRRSKSKSKLNASRRRSKRRTVSAAPTSVEIRDAAGVGR
jgi:hypothetical protein